MSMPATSSSIGSQKYFFVNNMAAKKDDVEEILSLDSPVKNYELHYNDTVSHARIAELALRSFFVVDEATRALHETDNEDEIKEHKQQSVEEFKTLINVLREIKQEEAESAQVLAEKISIFLEQNASNHATLILHGQGARIGKFALKILSASKSRISAYTIGGMINIRESYAAKVFNFHFKHDVISAAANAVFDTFLAKSWISDRTKLKGKINWLREKWLINKIPGLHSLVEIEYLDSSFKDTLKCHNLGVYLSNQRVRDAISQGI